MQATGDLVGNLDHIVLGYLGQVTRSPAAAGTSRYASLVTCHER